MTSSKVCLILVIVVALLWPGCAEKESASGPSTTDWSYLSGAWNGTLDIVRVGACQLSGQDSTRQSTTLELTVTGSGDISVSGDIFESQWSGEVDSASFIVLEKIVTWERGTTMSVASCPDSIVVDTVTYFAAVSQDSTGAYHIDMDARENWCPANSCVFRVRYLLEQQ